MKRFATAFLFFAALVALWHFGRDSLPRNYKLLLADPGEVAQYLYRSFKDGTMVTALYVTMRRLLLGYFIGIVVGVPLGLLTARFRWASDTIGVLGLGLQTLPSVCWVPMALLAYGQTEAAMQFVVIMGTLWSVQISTDDGVRNVPPIYQRAAQTMGSRGLHTWIKVILPASLPFIISGVKQGWAFAWRSLMGAEIFVTILTGSGLGMLLQYGRDNMQAEQILGVMLMIVAIGLLADKILFSPWERFLHKRWGLVKS